MDSDHVEVKLNDRRLRGWRMVMLDGPPGTRAFLEKATQGISRLNGGSTLEPHLDVLIRLEHPDGTIHHVQTGLRKLKAVGYQSLLDVFALVDDVAAGRDLADVVAELRPKALSSDTRYTVMGCGDRPDLAVEVVYAAVRLSQTWSKLLETEPLDPAQVLIAMDEAYRVGRLVREAEMPAERQRTRSLRKARDRSASAREWWREGARWAQSLVDTYPTQWRQGRRLGLNGLGAQLHDLWAERPFAPLGPAHVEATDLAKRVLPLWRELGLLKLPDR